jgi:hypothetical protein
MIGQRKWLFQLRSNKLGGAGFGTADPEGLSQWPAAIACILHTSTDSESKGGSQMTWCQ